MPDKVICPGKSSAAPFCVARFHMPIEDSVGAPAAAGIELVDGVLMAVMVLFQKLSALTSLLRPAVVASFVLAIAGAFVNASRVVLVSDVGWS